MSLRPHLTATFLLGLPLVGTHVSRMLIGVTDTILIGRYGLQRTLVIAAVLNIVAGLLALALDRVRAGGEAAAPDLAATIDEAPYALAIGALTAGGNAGSTLFEHHPHLLPLADRPVHHLSYGQRKRVALAGAVAMRPAVMLLDEPLTGLDASAAKPAASLSEASPPVRPEPEASVVRNRPHSSRSSPGKRSRLQ